MTCDGKLVKSLSGPIDRSDTQFLSGEIFSVGDPERILPLMGASDHLPLTLAVRGVTLPVEWSTRPPHLLYLTPQENELTAQRKAWSVYLSVGPKMRELRIWVDPKQDHAIQLIRWQSAPHTPIAYQMEVKHARHEPSGQWLPEWWEHVEYGEDDKPSRTRTSIVEKVTVNAVWPDSEFDVHFPPGTRVSDDRTHSLQVAEANGSLRPFRPGVDDAPPPDPFGWLKNDWFRSNGEWLTCITVFGVVAFAFLVWRLWPRGRKVA